MGFVVVGVARFWARENYLARGSSERTHTYLFVTLGSQRNRASEQENAKHKVQSKSLQRERKGREREKERGKERVKEGIMGTICRTN